MSVEDFKAKTGRNEPRVSIVARWAQDEFPAPTRATPEIRTARDLGFKIPRLTALLSVFPRGGPFGFDGQRILVSPTGFFEFSRTSRGRENELRNA